MVYSLCHKSGLRIRNRRISGLRIWQLVSLSALVAMVIVTISLEQCLLSGGANAPGIFPFKMWVFFF